MSSTSPKPPKPPALSKPPSTHTVRNTTPKPLPNSNPNSIAAQYARAKALQDAVDRQDREKVEGMLRDAGIGDGGFGKKKSVKERLAERKCERWKKEWTWVGAFFAWVM